MHLPIILVMLAAILAAEFSPTTPLPDTHWRTLIVMTIAFVQSCLALMQSEQVARLVSSGVGKTVVDQSLARREKFFSSVWFGSSAAILLIIRWPQVVRYNLALSDWFLIDELLILLPLFGPLLIAWYAFAGQEANSSGDPVSPRVRIERHRKQLSFFLGRVRIQLLLVVLPSLLFFAMRDLSQMLNFESKSDSIRSLFALMIPASVLSAMPMFVKVILHSNSLRETEFGSRQLANCESMGVRVRDIRIWKTKNRIINALVVGGLPWMRQIYFSDALLHSFDNNQVDAIARHEAGHIKRRHVPGRILALFLPVILAASWLLLTTSPETQLVENLLTTSPTWPEIVFLILFAVYGPIALALISRLYEHEADLFACCRIESQTKVLRIDADRLNDYHSMLKTMQIFTQQKMTWLHPKTGSRIELLERVQRDPAFGIRMLRCCRAFTITLLIVSIGLPLFALIVRATL